MKKNKKYYVMIVATMYDGLEFHQHLAIERDRIVTQEEAEKEATEYVLHQDTGEELECVDLIEITRKEYNVLRKFHI